MSRSLKVDETIVFRITHCFLQKLTIRNKNSQETLAIKQHTTAYGKQSKSINNIYFIKLEAIRNM